MRNYAMTWFAVASAAGLPLLMTNIAQADGPVSVSRDAPLPVRVEGRGLEGALADAQRDIPIRAMVERCGTSDQLQIAFNTDSATSPDVVLNALVDAHNTAGGAGFERHSETRANGDWTRLNEPGCSMLDTPISLDFTGTLGDALQPWADALSVASGETILLGNGVRSGGQVDVDVANVPARTVLLQILDTNANPSLAWSYHVRRSPSQWEPGYFVNFVPVTLDHDPVGSLDHGVQRVVDGVEYPVAD